MRGSYDNYATLLGAFAITLSFCLGCSSGPVNRPDDNRSTEQLEAIHTAYLECIAKNKRGPKDKEELIKYLPEGVDSASLFKSTRDDKDFIVVYGVNLDSYRSSAPVPVIYAYEQTGKGGMRFVATTQGVMQADDNAFEKELQFPKGHTPGATP